MKRWSFCPGEGVPADIVLEPAVGVDGSINFRIGVAPLRMCVLLSKVLDEILVAY